jgi:hypothetical protein
MSTDLDAAIHELICRGLTRDDICERLHVGPNLANLGFIEDLDQEDGALSSMESADIAIPKTCI